MSNEGREQVSRPPIREGRPVGEHPENCSCIPCDYARLRSRITALEAELDAEKAKVAKLREAVEPFKPDDDMVGDMEEDDEECVYVIVRKDDLRRARRIHEETA